MGHDKLSQLVLRWVNSVVSKITHCKGYRWKKREMTKIGNVFQHTEQEEIIRSEHH